jgi:uncharacterized OsmC-like protein
MSVDTRDALATALTDLQGKLREADQPSVLRFSADTRLVKGFLTDAAIRDFNLTVDEPAALGGTDRGPNPVELVLAALGTCQEITYATYARLLGVPLDRVEVTVSGELDLRGFLAAADDVPPGYQQIEYEVQIESPASPEVIEELVATVEKHCPLLDILQRGLPVRGSYRLNGEEEAAA